MDLRGSFVPYHYADSRGSKRFVVDAAYEKSSLIASAHKLAPALGRRDALKIGMAGAVAIGTLSATEKRAQANPVLWWLATEVLMVAAGWLINRIVSRVLDNTAGRRVDAVIDTLTTSESLFREVETTPVPLPKIGFELHVATADTIEIDPSLTLKEMEVPGYKLPFGVDRRLLPIDPRLAVAATTKIEAARGYHQEMPLLPPDYRRPFVSDYSKKWRTAFEKAKKLYDFEHEITSDDVAWCQSQRDADERLVYSFGLKADAAKKANLAVLLT